MVVLAVVNTRRGLLAMLRKIKLYVAAGIMFGFFAGGLIGATIPSGQASAACGRFLTFPAWYQGLEKAGCNGLKSPAEVAADKGLGQSEGLSTYVWIIVLNVIEIMLQIVGYLAVFYIIYGGFQLIISNGSADKMAKAQKTVLNASIGLVIAITAIAIKDFVWRIVVGGSNPNYPGIPQGDVGAILVAVLNVVYFAAAAAAVIVIVIAGLTYATSAGDPGKTAKAKNTILYAIIGLAITIFAFAITGFIDRSI